MRSPYGVAMTISYPISPFVVELPRGDLRLMIRVVRTLYALSENNAYQTLLQNTLPLSAQIKPRHYAVMMGYDFHLSAEGVSLIEVNTNAGGLWFACLAHNTQINAFPEPLARRLLATFLNEYTLFCQQPQAKPRCIVIMDDAPEQQFLYAEMQQFAALFRQAGIQVFVVAPDTLSLKNDGLYCHGQRVDLLYNRHCDFYLFSEALQAVRGAWLKGLLCLSPNPHAYGLLADKQRMVLWSNTTALAELGVPLDTLRLLARTIPQTQWLSTLTTEDVWATRKSWVFKPDTGYGSRGVYIGDKLTKNKLVELNAAATLIQQRIPPSLHKIDAQTQFKTDFRLFVYRNQILAVTARLYQGQVTNLRTENGGFARVNVV